MKVLKRSQLALPSGGRVAVQEISPYDRIFVRIKLKGDRIAPENAEGSTSGCETGGHKLFDLSKFHFTLGTVLEILPLYPS